MRSALLLLLAVVSLAVATPGAAQLRADSLVVRPGDRIRLGVADGTEPRFPTSLRRLSPDTFYVVRRGDADHAVPVASLIRLDVSRGGRGRGAVVGGAAGAVLLAIPAFLLSRRSSAATAPDAVIGLTLLAGAVGGASGAWIGASLGERWQPVLPPSR